MGRNKKIQNNILIGILGLIIFIIFIGVFFIKNKQPEEVVSQPEVNVEEVTEEVPMEEVQEEIPEEEPIVYEAPEYEFKTDEFILELPGISKEYTIAWVSDVQMVADTEPANDVKAEFMDAVNVRYNMFKTTDETPIYSFEKLNKNVPTMYVRADHDYHYGYGGDVLTEPVAWQMHAEEIEDLDANDSRYLEFDDFVIIGINRSTKNMAPGVYDWVKEKYDKAVEQEKAVIIATHVPYESKVDSRLEELSMQVKNKIYYWGGGAYVPYEDTKTYFDTLIYSNNTAVEGVLAGHMHHTWEGQLTESVKQHIFTLAYEGYIGIVHIKPGETE